MYTCTGCKKQFADSPAITNACGSFCAQCKAQMIEKSANSRHETSRALNGCCLWCGEKITPELALSGHPDENVCKLCRGHREWLLKVIRLSDRPIKYANRTEERERPLREEREKFMIATAKTKSAVATETTESDARLLRLEGMLDKLTKALGV